MTSGITKAFIHDDGAVLAATIGSACVLLAAVHRKLDICLARIVEVYHIRETEPIKQLSGPDTLRTEKQDSIRMEA